MKNKKNLKIEHLFYSTSLKETIILSEILKEPLSKQKKNRKKQKY